MKKNKILKLKTFIIFGLLLSVFTSLSSEESVQLKWKMPKKHKAFLFSQTKVTKKTSKEKTTEKGIHLFLLTLQANNRINAKLIIEKSKKGDSTVSRKDESRVGSSPYAVPIRGEFTELGEITSFYYKQSQKNLLAILFELPGKKIKVGDSWSLKNVSLIFNDNNFICESASRSNKVSFVKLEKDENGDRIAHLRYYLSEKVVGRYFRKRARLRLTFIGRAEFNIDQGGWKKFRVSESYESNEDNGINSLKVLSLTPTTQIPLRMLDVE